MKSLTIKKSNILKRAENVLIAMNWICHIKSLLSGEKASEFAGKFVSNQLMSPFHFQLWTLPIRRWSHCTVCCLRDATVIHTGAEWSESKHWWPLIQQCNLHFSVHKTQYVHPSGPYVQFPPIRPYRHWTQIAGFIERLYWTRKVTPFLQLHSIHTV